jgi:predicted phage terminase large subunit-like protein
VVTVAGSCLRNSNEFEIVDSEGSFKSVGVGGGLTGNTVDIMIMDDLYKDYQDATSPIISARVWEWYLTVVKTRLHNDSQELIVFTRWDENDLIGRLEAMGLVREYTPDDDLDELIGSLASDQWLKINFTALKIGDPNKIDPREQGAALWPEKHNVEKLTETRDLDPTKFNALYQGDPESKEGRLYQPFETYQTPPKFKIIKNQIDTADEGKDYLCSIVYGVPLEDSENLYILDVIYTTEGMETTEPMVAGQLNAAGVNESSIESNNGGRGFARTIDKTTNLSVNVSWYHQTENKKARIFSNSATVNRRVLFPEHWASIFGEFYDHVTQFKKDFTSPHDDAPDVLTAIVEDNEAKQPAAVINW